MMDTASHSGRGLIQKRVLIQASPETVFGALTDAKELERWFCDRADSDPRAGGELKAQWHAGNAGQQGRALFTRVVPFSSVALEWVDDGDGRAGGIRHELTYDIKSSRYGCEVVMRDQGCSLPDEETLAILDEGWITVLRDLKDHCESKERSLRRIRAKEASSQ
jgi:uncharacterized protein YndB with AHSA1/START domain